MSEEWETLPGVISSETLAASELTKPPSSLIPQDADVLVLASSIKLQAKMMLKFSFFFSLYTLLLKKKKKKAYPDYKPCLEI